MGVDSPSLLYFLPQLPFYTFANRRQLLLVTSFSNPFSKNEYIMCATHSQTATESKPDVSGQQQIRASVLHGAKDLRIVSCPQQILL